MNKAKLEVLCFDKFSFDQIMEDKGWIDNITGTTAAVSICSPGEGEWSEHWFKNDYHTDARYFRIFNLDIDDSHPFWFENHESECYDKALELYLQGHIKQSNAYFNHAYVSGKNKEFFDVLHVMDYEEAFDLVKWIDVLIQSKNVFYIHCAAGASRSQGVVRFICDTYKDRFDIQLNPYNPNNTYNPHVVLMLKRAYRELFMKNTDDSYFETEPQKLDSDIHINIL